ncbi:MAG: hypothetical protein COY38_01005 [Candidatus Aenigmarchaeota archaeon CG_4_10_14_0_8_um_filter_37_24]|nr:hypothetical protein [Candidatus Aenigmarchaeota archaeon]OIN88182.1 MAG: hypothetical protein AUJ50_01555 [Candidatus Aenigmarchaeota archaeon CG1_02_38_14]PIV68657.1 MAG: hypothetical protein COS07_03385 [Candidatus Aenigmarchaeota archaeon CG01_land_8_20_14_3_00_37_9]PIW41114.1 MAG: hypothetical protein COW21_03645 [Candidatus Aenigmarchaeota archaeon CG15_BIG_FIL_POST_REV_8_21_14_020_37_27]PIX50903.1 MAG: hypothetical protein COZ52_01745 [Candidatus Aenigmarchaeota archaeon CG_4_8_14_3_u
MLKMLFFHDNNAPSKIQEEFVKNIEILFKGKVEIERLEADKNQRTAKEYGVKETPAIIIEKDGKVADKFIGFTQELFLKRALERSL